MLTGQAVHSSLDEGPVKPKTSIKDLNPEKDQLEQQLVQMPRLASLRQGLNPRRQKLVLPTMGRDTRTD